MLLLSGLSVICINLFFSSILIDYTFHLVYNYFLFTMLKSRHKGVISQVNIVEKTYVKEMNILKGIGILLVVLGHSFPDGVGSGNYRFLHQWIYSFHMPLFFLVSGFFAKRVFEITNFQEYIFLVKDKFKRLIVPYFILSFVAIPLKLILNRYALRPIDLHTLISQVFLYPLDNPIIFFWFIYDSGAKSLKIQSKFSPKGLSKLVFPSYGCFNP